MQHDPAHARCVAFVGRRLAALGWPVRHEVEIDGGRSHGWIDVVAFDGNGGTLFVVEVKAAMPDLGGAQRQLAWYARAALDKARVDGWRARSVISALLVLATTENDERLHQNRALVDQGFPGRAENLERWLSGGAEPPQPVVALIDPRSRRRRWLMPTKIDGRRYPLRYASYADYMQKVRAG